MKFLFDIFLPYRKSECTGSKSLCEYLMDLNDTLMEASLKYTPWLTVSMCILGKVRNLFMYLLW